MLFHQLSTWAPRHRFHATSGNSLNQCIKRLSFAYQKLRWEEKRLPFGVEVWWQPHSTSYYNKAAIVPTVNKNNNFVHCGHLPFAFWYLSSSQSVLLWPDERWLLVHIDDNPKELVLEVGTALRLPMTSLSSSAERALCYKIEIDSGIWQTNPIWCARTISDTVYFAWRMPKVDLYLFCADDLLLYSVCYSVLLCSLVVHVYWKTLDWQSSVFLVKCCCGSLCNLVKLINVGICPLPLLCISSLLQVCCTRTLPTLEGAYTIWP